jgi:membrane-associated phospholipid phosphatase
MDKTLIRQESSPPQERRHRSFLFQSVLGVFIIAFAILTWTVTKTAYFAYDLSLTRALQSLHNPIAIGLLKAVSWAGDAPQAAIVPALLVVLLYGLGLHWEATASLITAVFVELSNLLLKVAIHRPRPTADLVHISSTFGSYSFPSGHVMFYTGFYGFIVFLVFILLKPSWKRTLLLFIFGSQILLVGASRIYLGAHWASDVIGAYLMGCIALIVCIGLYRWGKTRFFIHQPVAKETKHA